LPCFIKEQQFLLEGERIEIEERETRRERKGGER